MLLSTITLDDITQTCAVIGVIPAIIVTFIVCTYGFYSIRDDEQEDIILVLIFASVAGIITWGYITFSVVTVPVTIFVALSYFTALKLKKYQISISKNNEDKTP